MIDPSHDLKGPYLRRFLSFYLLHNIMSPYADFHNHPVALASGVTAAAIVLFALKYNDRAVFEELPPGIAFTPGWPPAGSLAESLHQQGQIARLGAL